MISHEDRALQSFQQGTFADIGVGVVDEYTRFHITFCINMKISSSSGDTSADILCVVLEVHGEDRFGLTELTDPLVNFCTLFRVWKKFRNGSVSYRHIMEEPDEQCAGVNDHIKERFTADILIVLACVAGGNTEWEFMLFHQFHCMHYFFVIAAASSSVVGFLKTFQADGRNKILYAEHFVAEIFVDQCSVGEA